MSMRAIMGGLVAKALDEFDQAAGAALAARIVSVRIARFARAGAARRVSFR